MPRALRSSRVAPMSVANDENVQPPITSMLKQTKGLSVFSENTHLKNTRSAAAKRRSGVLSDKTNVTKSSTTHSKSSVVRKVSAAKRAKLVVYDEEEVVEASSPPPPPTPLVVASKLMTKETNQLYPNLTVPKFPPGVGDINKHVETTNTHIYCASYSSEIYAYLRELELELRPREEYMKKQKEINAEMRTILIDWLVEVVDEYCLCHETLHLACNYIDRFLGRVRVGKEKLQLVGVTAILIASKFEDIYPVTVDNLVYITDNTYTREQIIKMETVILRALNYRLSGVTTLALAEPLIRVMPPHEEMEPLTHYLLDLSLQDYGMLKFLPSEIATAAAVIASNNILAECWNAQIEHYSFYKYSRVEPCVNALLKLHAAAATSKHVAIKDKYDTPTFCHVSDQELEAPTEASLRNKHSSVLRHTTRKAASCTSSNSVKKGK